MRKWFVMSVMGISFFVLVTTGCKTFTGQVAGTESVTTASGQVSEKEPVKSFTDPVTGMEFVLVVGGCFDMGDTFGESAGNRQFVFSGGAGSNEMPVHNVCVDDYYLGKYEVTQEQWQTVMGNNPSRFSNCGANCPVEQVSWNDAQEFVQKLNTKTGKNYRLPTEAEWEYAARSGGKQEQYSGSDLPGDVGWYYRNSGFKTHPVGQKQPNGIGLYDMTGNVWEWCQDRYDQNYYSKSPQDNPQGPDQGNYRVVRGGSWYGAGKDVRASIRGTVIPDYRHGHYGFRLCLSAP